MIEFKGKIESVYNVDDSLAWRLIKIPILERRHCDMAAFRKHPKYGGWANSTLFPGMLARIARDAGRDGYLRLDRIPEHVTVDETGFLAKVTIKV